MQEVAYKAWLYSTKRRCWLSLNSCGGADQAICTPHLSPDTHVTNTGLVEIACGPSMALSYMQRMPPAASTASSTVRLVLCTSNDAAVLRTIWTPPSLPCDVFVSFTPKCLYSCNPPNPSD